MSDTPELPAFRIGPVQGYDQAIKEMVRITRAVGDDRIDLDKGHKMVQMLGRVVQAINFRRRTELEERRLDLLGAAAESGAAVFEGFAIIPPASRLSGPGAAAPPPTVELEPGEAVRIKPPRTRKKK